MLDSLLQFIIQGNHQVSTWLLPYVDEALMLLMVCLTSIYGASINKLVKRVVGSRHFLIRTLIFVLVTGVGLGMAILFCAPILAKWSLFIPQHWLPLCFLTLFIGLGMLADRKNQI